MLLAWGDNRDVFFGNAVLDPADPNAQFLYSPPVNAAPVLQAPGFQAGSEESRDLDSPETLLADKAGDETKVILDHSGFPDDAAEHLDGGWHKMYWEPLKAYCE